MPQIALVLFSVIVVAALISVILVFWFFTLIDLIDSLSEEDSYKKSCTSRMKEISQPIEKSKIEPLEKSKIEPFTLSEYYDRMEKAALDILESNDPVDKTIILWWGLDGLRMNEDGSLEWISRKKPEPVTQSVFYQPMQSLEQVQYPTYSGYDGCQSTRDKLNALQAKLDDINAQLPNCQVRYPQYIQYPVYFYGGFCQQTPLQQLPDWMR